MGTLLLIHSSIPLFNTLPSFSAVLSQKTMFTFTLSYVNEIKNNFFFSVVLSLLASITLSAQYYSAGPVGADKTVRKKTGKT